MSYPREEFDLVVVLWANHAHPEGGRPFETLTSPGTRIPLAWSLSALRSKFGKLLESSYLVMSEADLQSWTSPLLLPTVTREQPLLVPVPIARAVLGWQEFARWDDL